jgi:NADH-quinone oxidoreductase subunit F
MMIEIKVGLGTCGASAGGVQVFDVLQREIQQKKLNVSLKETGCLGMCYEEVLVEVVENGSSFLYGRVDPEKAKKIIDQHIINNKPVEEWIVNHLPGGEREEFFKKQNRIVLRNCGYIDPASIDDYRAQNGYKAIQKVLHEYTPDEVIKIISDSGLRGRGGGGFKTGLKWKFARNEKSEKKYIICNADEGDPGAFMDRSVLESDPHSVLEGMMIAGFAIGADEAYIYVRAEYPKAILRLNEAIIQCLERNYLGAGIFGSEFDFTIKIKEGAGAFVCGEETALIASIEGKRGVPRLRPPFPANKGLWGKPTNINNVETFANVPWIILNGAEKFSASKKAKEPRSSLLPGKL